MKKITDGEWKYNEMTGEIISSEGQITIAQTPLLKLIECNAPQHLIEEAEANGRLIAESKELLEVVQGLSRALDRMIYKHDRDSIETEWLIHSHEIMHRLENKPKQKKDKSQSYSL